MTDEQDFTDPEWVLGAVLAQLEDLNPAQQRQVLIDAMANVTKTPLRPELRLLGEPLVAELWDQYQSAEDQFGEDYFWRKHGHKEFIIRFREALGAKAPSV